MNYRIKDIREDHDLRQKDMAEIMKTTQQHYSKIELGKADLDGQKIVLLAKHFQVSADYILGLVNEPKRLK
ncbi:MAG: helix-turn-helix transcriptional regulator [Clostridia bacterium]|nr:helix-turn-helix transcriptional regulator [Clostridia bacterium]